jgi:hypothetical protein
LYSYNDILVVGKKLKTVKTMSVKGRPYSSLSFKIVTDLLLIGQLY